MGELLDRVVTDSNMKHAVECLNLSACSGIDRQRPRSFVRRFPYAKEAIRCQILYGKYRPTPLLRTYIPKKGKDNEYRMLGIPSSKDRMIQFAMAQVIAPLFEPHFSANSYGFIKGRNCYDALEHVRQLANEGKTFAISIDLRKFFDTVPHKVLMRILRRKIKDEELLNLIQHYLKTPVIETDENNRKKRIEITKGVPQGGPLSPLLANIVLNELDAYLHRHNICFARYADDCIILTGGIMEALDTFGHVSKYIEDVLELEINYDKTYLRDITETEYLGFTFREDCFGYSFCVPDKKFVTLKERMMAITVDKYGNISPKEFAKKMMELTRGWINYYGLADIRDELQEIDEWFRQQILCINRYKLDVYKKEYNELILAGMEYKRAESLVNTILCICQEAVVPKGVTPERQYDWLIKAGYQTCVELYDKRRLKDGEE